MSLIPAPRKQDSTTRKRTIARGKLQIVRTAEELLIQLESDDPFDVVQRPIIRNILKGMKKSLAGIPIANFTERMRKFYEV